MERNFETALRSLSGNKVRTGLTVAIIAVGIMSLVGIQTAIEIMAEKVAGSFSKLGADMFTIESGSEGRPVSYRDAREFERQCTFAVVISTSAVRSSVCQARSGGAVTDPVVTVIASDEHYLDVQSVSVASGRNLSESDISSRACVAIIGDGVRNKLYGEESGLGRTLSVCGRHYLVVGEMDRQGAMFGNGVDNSVIVPLDNDPECSVTVMPEPEIEFMDAVSRAKALMRSVRRLRPDMAADFDIVRADTMQSNLSSIKEKLSIAALVIGMITLLGSAVGLMNIMLVSVKERTREIGTRKALGATQRTIIRQFLAESVLVGQIGGVIGILAGLLFGNVVALVMDGSFTVPWDWVAASVMICLAVSLLSGMVPARRAAALDPIEALRDE